VKVEIIKHFQMQDKDVKPYVVYVIRVNVGSLVWDTRKRYRNFSSLHQSLEALNAPPEAKELLPQLPGKKLFGNLDPAFLDKRLIELQDYLQEIADIPFYAASAPFLSFLGALENISDYQEFSLVHNSVMYDQLSSIVDSGDVVLFRTDGGLLAFFSSCCVWGLFNFCFPFRCNVGYAAQTYWKSIRSRWNDHPSSRVEVGRGRRFVTYIAVVYQFRQ